MTNTPAEAGGRLMPSDPPPDSVAVQLTPGAVAISRVSYEALGPGMRRFLFAANAEVFVVEPDGEAVQLCPAGCGCRRGKGDADRQDCACDGPCTMDFDWDDD